jgi:glycosyltransferase involved in cell wall biosynthesis
MKVIHILNSLKFSGAEIMYVDAAPIFQEKGCDLTVVATAEELGEYAPYFKKAGYKVIHKPMPKIKNYYIRIRYYLTFVNMLKNGKYDIVHIHSHNAMWGIAMCAWMANKKSIYTFHNVFPTRLFTYFYHILLRWSAKYVFKCRFQTISDSVYDHELNLYHNKTIKIYNWYGSNRYFPAEKAEKLVTRNELKIDQNSFVLISVGGCSPVKRHSEILKALPIILKKIPNCMYLHLGKGISELDEIKLATELGVLEHVRFCGNQENVRKYLISSDIYLMPSSFEGIPITTIEAMACKIPTILYDVPGLRDFNKNGENCILIPEDYRILADKVISMYLNSEFCSEISSKAYNLVNKSFNMKSNVNQIFKLYN